MLMDFDAKGMHMDLMCISWQQEQPGTLPNEELIIRRWLKNPTSSVWKRVWPQIKEAWQTSKKNPFKLYSRALLREFKKQRAFSNKQKQNVEKRWKNRVDHNDTTVLPRNHSGNARAGYALQSSSSPPGFNIPYIPPGGTLAAPEVNGRRHNGTNQRALGNNPRAQGTNPKAVESKAIQAAAKASRYRDPVIPEDEQMSVEEMKAIRQANVGILPSELTDTLKEIVKLEPEVEERNADYEAEK